MDPKPSESKPSVKEEDLPEASPPDAPASQGDGPSAANNGPGQPRPRPATRKLPPGAQAAPRPKSGPAPRKGVATRSKTPPPAARPGRPAGAGASPPGGKPNASPTGGSAPTPGKAPPKGTPSKKPAEGGGAGAGEPLPPKGTTPDKKAATEPGASGEAPRPRAADDAPQPAGEDSRPQGPESTSASARPGGEGAKPGTGRIAPPAGEAAAEEPTPEGARATDDAATPPVVEAYQPSEAAPGEGLTERAAEGGELVDGDADATQAEALEVPGLPGQVRYFEDATELLLQTMRSIQEEEVIGWAHDRVDPDTMGANGLMWYILREVFGKRYVCYYSKRMSFLMNRSLATNFMPSGVLRRCERTENLSEIVLKAPLIIVLDATCPEIMTDFSRLLRRNKEVRQKPILFYDHHRKGESDIDDLPHARGVRYEKAQATSAILVHVARNLGLDLRGTEEGFRLAVVARAGIDTDLIGVDPSGYSDSTIAALEYLDEVLGERGHEILDKLRSIKHPLSWYRKLGEALSEVENYDPTVAVVGLGVIDDTGIVPFVANRLLEVGGFKTTIVFGLVYDRIEGQIISVDLDASGRSNQDTEVVLPDLFHEIFFVTSPDGRKTSKGGGRANMLMGDYSGAGASVPLDYWRQLGTKSADEKIQVLHRLAWPAEFLRLRHLLTSRIHSLKAEEIRSVVPVPTLEGL